MGFGLKGIVLFAALVALGSCNYLGQNSDFEGEPVVRVGDNYLSREELQKSIPLGSDSLDSSLLASKFINSWVERQLLIDRAELNLNEDQKNFDKQLSDYKNNLIIYTYEQALIRQNLDTNISDTEIEQYYNENSQNFELRDYVVKVNWMKLDKEAPKLKKIRGLFGSEEEDDIRALEDYCVQFASNCQLEDVWIYFDEFLRFVPVQTINVEQFLRTNQNFELEGEQFLYLVNIKEYKLKNSTSPLELENKRIKNIILNQRKLQLLSGIRKGLLEEGIAKNKVEYYQ